MQKVGATAPPSVRVCACVCVGGGGGGFNNQLGSRLQLPFCLVCRLHLLQPGGTHRPSPRSWSACTRWLQYIDQNKLQPTFPQFDTSFCLCRNGRNCKKQDCCPLVCKSFQFLDRQVSIAWGLGLGLGWALGWMVVMAQVRQRLPSRTRCFSGTTLRLETPYQWIQTCCSCSVRTC